LSKKVNISIPKPCHENWEAMTPEDKGRFCSVCTKTVFDFTKASDKEIIEHLNKDATTCGRFISSQLNRDLIVPKEKSPYWIFASATLFSFLGIGSQSTYSQVRQDTIQTDKKDLNQDSIKTEKNPFTITGVVSDELGPIAGVNVVVKGTIRGTTTDFDGKFAIKANEKEVLIFTYTGKKTIELIISSKSEYHVSMPEDVIISTGITVVAGYVKKRTFFGRQIQSVRNWFR
jgi:uncharacterized protein YbaA (DUF1428 family)